MIHQMSLDVCVGRVDGIHARAMSGRSEAGVRRVCCGESHTLALTDEGTRPSPLTHEVTTSATGVAWGWGRNDRGQVGLGESDKQAVLLPALVLLAGSEISVVLTDVASGASHNLARDATGGVLSWGYGEYGQLGHGDCQNCLVASPVQALQASRDCLPEITHALNCACKGRRVSHIGCGDWHSLCVLRSGECMVMGLGASVRESFMHSESWC